MDYPLEERTLRFSKALLDYLKNLKQDSITKPLITQVTRSGTSIGANYCEANGASSKKDFKNKIHICKKESQETRYWLNLLKETVGESEELTNLIKESHEFSMIFGKITKTLSGN